MKKTMMALALCLMSVISFAGNRQVTTNLPKNTPSVTLTIDGRKTVVKPTKAALKEVDEKHVDCVVYAGKNTAKVTLPLSFENALACIVRTAEIANTFGLISDEDYDKVLRYYQDKVGM